MRPGSAVLDTLHAPAEPEEISELVQRALAGLPGSLPADCLTYMANQARTLHITRIREALVTSEALRSSGTAEGAGLADFLGFQAVSPLSWRGWLHKPDCPDGMDAIFRWAAARLHAYGSKQSRCLALVAAKICRWCRKQDITELDLIESPVGGTLPTVVIATALRSSGVIARVHEFLAPRLDAHGKKYSIRASAAQFCSRFPRGATPILFADEVVTGTRFRKLKRELAKHLGSRLIPIALEVRDLARPSRPQLSKLRNQLRALPAAATGAPTHTIFPPASLITVDEGAPFVASVPFFWGEVDLCAGKRKVNFVFGLINELRGIAEDLLDPKSGALTSLCEIQRWDSQGVQTVGHERFAQQLVDRCVPLIRWSDIEQQARIQFKAEYMGVAPTIDDAWVRERINWVLSAVYAQLVPHCPSAQPPNEAGYIQNALMDLFSMKGGLARRWAPPDRDFCEYTIPYPHPFKAFHEELVRCVLANIPVESDVMADALPTGASD